IDQGGLAQAFGVFDEAGIEAASCLLGGCMLHDPVLGRFYDAEGRLAHSYVAIVLAVDAQLMVKAKGIASEELLAPGHSLSLPDAALFTATRKVRAGKGARPAVRSATSPCQPGRGRPKAASPSRTARHAPPYPAQHPS
ncbi:MAG: hypothetical protein J5863_09270, partial [Desulfovibrio sp.]|nr:hypothetical protein [Desulfovibrio sp.]